MRSTRREFLTWSRAAALAGVLPHSALLLAVKGSEPVQGLSTPSEEAQSLYRRALVIDANTLASIGALGTDATVKMELQAIRDSGISVVKSSLGGASASFEEAVSEIAAAQAFLERYPESFLKVTRAADLERAKSEQKTGVIFSFEAASMLEENLERIPIFRQLDVLVMQLTYNHKTLFGYGCLDGDAGGLTELGRKAVALLQAQGVALDLSHANIQTTMDALAIATRPPVITHAGCRSVFYHPRNKTDQEMRALAEKGGVMGIYMLPFLTEETRQPVLADYIAHVVHALKICGEEHVGIGTDSMFFQIGAADLEQIAKEEEQRKEQGVGAPGENRPPYLPDVNTPRKLMYVADALLKQGYSARVVEKVLGKNFERVLQQAWTA